jgi:dienelactone hydrolase
MELVEKAIAFLKGYEEGRYKKIGTYGTSLGSMPALEAAILFQDISSVIVVSPTHIITEGFATRTKMTGNSFLTFQGKDIEYCPIPENMKMYEMFETAYNNRNKGELQVEKVKGKLLFIASEKDETWPTVASIQSMEKRLEEKHFAYEHRAIIFKEASHLAGITPNMKKHKLLQLIRFYFRQERKCKKACIEARRTSEIEIMNWITSW